MEKHKCKSCDKAFASGRALGGHMRSHFAKLPVPRHAPRAEPSTPPSELSSDSSVCHWAASAEGEGEEGADSSVVAPFCRQRKRRLGASSPEENVALCLMMLSRDSWTPLVKPTQKAREEGGGGGRGGEVGGEKLGNRSRYECDTCKKVFGSYQALGGHRGSHKKMKIQSSPPAENHFNFAAAVGGLGNIIKTHECPYCFKVFETGQALGGHKKIHTFNSILPTPPITAAADNSAHRHAARSAPMKFIDLNLPAPLHDDEDSDNIAEVSAVSDPAVHYAMARR